MFYLWYSEILSALHLSFCIVDENKFGSSNKVCFLMKYQSMKCSCSHEWNQPNWRRLGQIRAGISYLYLWVWVLCRTSLKLKYEGNVSESQTPDIWSSIGQKQLKIPFVILEIRSRVLSNIFLSLKPNFLLLIPHRLLTVLFFCLFKRIATSYKDILW